MYNKKESFIVYVVECLKLIFSLIMLVARYMALITGGIYTLLLKRERILEPPMRVATYDMVRVNNWLKEYMIMIMFFWSMTNVSLVAVLLLYMIKY
jgi:hypothetical protein